jgi:ABC-type cobalamin/Fe3+-siderophores transport system ATPase subunit
MYSHGPTPSVLRTTSTTVRAVSGVVPAQSGSARKNGTNLLTVPASERARIISVVPQVASLPPAFTVWETVLLGRTPYLNFLGQVSAADEGIARQSLQRVDALDLIDRRVGELSGGEQQRVLLARALAQSTPILLLDEPTSHLDLHHQVGLLELVRTLAHHDGLAVLIALHDLNLAARYADRMTTARKLLHTRYRVNDLERTVKFYREVLGLEEVRRHKSPRGSELVFLKAPESEELIEICSFPASGLVQVQPDHETQG